MMIHSCFLVHLIVCIACIIQSGVVTSASHGSHLHGSIDARVNVFQVPLTIKQMNILVISDYSINNFVSFLLYDQFHLALKRKILNFNYL